MELTENALKVLQARYLLRNENGIIVETTEQMFRRVAGNIAIAERVYEEDSAYWEDRFYDLMSSLKFLPNSPALMNAGKEMGQLAACFVLPVEDSMTSIFDTLKNAALILQSGGGTGFSFSRLRPKADIVRSTGGIASGPVSFMKIYNTATDVIKQGGARRGANMGILRVDHPDILEFIKIKRTEGGLSNFNISVAITDEFMEALNSDGEYNVRNPRSEEITGRLRAEVVFDEIVQSAWETGDPGLVFIDRINRANPTPHIGSFESTNPCGEQPLLPYEACVLGSIDVSKYVMNNRNSVGKGDSPDSTTSLREVRKSGTVPVTKERIDWSALGKDVGTAVRFLDDAIDANIYPMPRIENMHKGNRKIGLGVMGWADTLILMGIPYNDRRAFALARKTMKFIRDTAREASVALAERRGVFPNFSGSVYDTPGMPRVRNATTTTIAPTGTLATIAGCSSGIEPLFAVAYKRLVIDTELYEINRHFVETAKERGFYSEGLMNDVRKTGMLRGIREIPLEVRKLFRTALEISPEDHIEMQAAFQEYTDNAVSKTINLPHKAKKEDVAKAYLLAWQKNVKGVTVFRYGAKMGTLVKFTDSD